MTKCSQLWTYGSNSQATATRIPNLCKCKRVWRSQLEASCCSWALDSHVVSLSSILSNSFCTEVFVQTTSSAEASWEVRASCPQHEEIHFPKARISFKWQGPPCLKSQSYFCLQQMPWCLLLLTYWCSTEGGSSYSERFLREILKWLTQKAIRCNWNFPRCLKDKS